MKGTRQAVVALDIALFGAGAVKTAIGLVCAVAIGAWLHAWVAAVFLVAGILLVRGMYWSSLLVLIGSAYADWPARQWLGVELSEYVPIQALVAVPLWLVVMEYPSRLEGRAKYAAWVCCFTAFVAGWGAPFLQDGRYWLVAAPLALAAVVVLVWRMWRAHVPLGTRGWICCAAIAPAAGWVTWFVLVPDTPYPYWLMLSLNLWLSMAPLLLVLVHWRSGRHDGTGTSGLGLDDRDVQRRNRNDGTGRKGAIRRLVFAFSEAASGSRRLPSAEGRHGAEARQDGRVLLGVVGSGWRGDGRSVDARIGVDRRADGADASLRPAAEVEPEDFGTGPLTPLAKEAR